MHCNEDDPIPTSIVGADVANEMIRSFRAHDVGRITVERWIAELRVEGFANLAREVERRLPKLN